MKLQLFVLIAAFSALILPLGNPGAARGEVAFVQTPGLDRACALLRGQAVDPHWQAELSVRMPQLEAAWRQDGRPLLMRALLLSGAHQRRAYQVQLTLCDLPSSSWFGPVVNMRYALASFTNDPVPMRYKAVTAAHELLHGALAGVDLSDSALLAAHARESERVRAHLHLFALMKAALIDLGRADLLAEVRLIDGQLPGGSYKRAWAIVDSTPDGYLSIVAEVQAAQATQTAKPL